ncbi:hypothetical protein L7F22_066395 [Adiantum nelumboides]|nr:hypothetical protein [Adiantum nelumboides]
MYYCPHPRRIGNFRGPRNQVSPPRERQQQQPPFPIQQAPPVQILRPPMQPQPQQPPPPPLPIAPIPPLPIPENRAVNVISLDAKVKAEEEERGKSLPKDKGKAKVEDVDAMPIKRARQEEAAMSETGEGRRSKENGESSSKKKSKPRRKLTIKDFALDEVIEQAHVYAALDPSERNRQFSILEAQGDYQGKSLTFLIDSRSSHSFISPSIVKHLHLEPWSTGKKLQVSLASGSIKSCEEQIVELLFQLKGISTNQRLIVLKMEKFQEILGLDWLNENKADIHRSQGMVSFYSSNKEQVYIHGRRGNTPLRVVKAKQLMKGLRKVLPLYVLKLNKPEKESEGKETEDREPEWLSEFLDVFLEELIDLSPTRGLVHDITLVPGAQPIAKLLYKMSLSEALELKNQLTQLLEKSFI